MKLSFFVTGNPKGQPRARRGRGRHVYDPGTADDWRQRVQEHLMVAWDGMPFVGPVGVWLEFHFKRPRSHYRKSGLKPTAPHRWCESGYDRDNLDKAVLDALTEAHLWRDDKSVCDGGVKKVWAESPGCHITVKALEE